MRLLDSMTEKTFSVRAVVVMLLIFTLVVNTYRDPVGWRDMFNSALCTVIGYYFGKEAQKTPNQTEGKPTP